MNKYETLCHMFVGKDRVHQLNEDFVFKQKKKALLILGSPVEELFYYIFTYLFGNGSEF